MPEITKYGTLSAVTRARLKQRRNDAFVDIKVELNAEAEVHGQDIVCTRSRQSCGACARGDLSLNLRPLASPPISLPYMICTPERSL